MRGFRKVKLIPAAALSLLFLLCVSSCSYIFRPDFDEFAMNIFRHEMSGSTLNLHYSLTSPQSYGIKEDAPSLGHISMDGFEKELSYLKKCQNRLKDYLNKGLNEDDRMTAELLDWWLEGQIKSEDYYYYQEPLGPTLGIQAQLPVLLAEFPFRSAGDIDIYLKLLESLPEYFREIAKFEREKSEQGLFMSDEILDKILAQCRSISPIGSSHFLITSFRERLDDCDFLNSEQRVTYDKQNQRALMDFFQPAYEELCQALEALRESGTNGEGFCHLPDGLSYYKYLLKYNIGTDLGMAKIRQLLEYQMEDDYETILYALSKNIDFMDVTDDPKAADSPADILKRLQSQIQQDFPQARSIDWQVKEVPESLTDYLSPAFYMTPAIDAEEENIIYINPSYSPGQHELVTALAHEGYPGHMYQNSFENTDSYHPVRNLFYVGGYVEGWGLYSEFYAYDYLGLSDMEGEFLRALSSFNFAICASLDLAIHGEGWSEEDCLDYLESFGITDKAQVHELYLNILEEPSNYLKYYLGYLEICRLRESALALSPKITIYDFHKWFLETGSAPFSLLRERLDSLEVSSELLQTADEELQFLALETVHDRLYHPLMERGMMIVSVDPLLRQREQHDPFVLRAADAGDVSLLHQTVDRGG